VDAAELEEEVVAGVLLLTVGGRVRRLPELKWRANRAWQERIAATYRTLASVVADSPEGQLAMTEVEHDLILAYDATGALGDLEDATETELSALYTKLLEVSYPNAKSVMAVQILMMQEAVRAASSDLGSSTSGPSPTGPSEVPTTSRPPSRSARRSSSARAARSGSTPSSGAG